MKRTIIAAIIFILILGCSTPSQMAKLQGRGTTQVYNVPADQVWQKATDTAWKLGLTVLRTYPRQGFIEAKRGMQFYTLGENVGIWVKQVGPNQTSVEVLSRQKGPPVLKYKNWETDFLAELGHELGPNTMLAQGTAPGNSGTMRGTQTGPVRPTELDRRIQPAVVRQTTAVAGVPESELILRDKLKRYLEIRSVEVQSEPDPKRRELLQFEMDYMRRELTNVEDTIARQSVR
ncbi:MAG TPA: hypothetical protein VGE41_11785 [Verrucomicrobiae bacterium]|jgi:hypothetical protein